MVDDADCYLMLEEALRLVHAIQRLTRVAEVREWQGGRGDPDGQVEA